MPEHVVPMMARLSTLPRDDGGWAYEMKWDGVRAMVHVRRGKLRVDSRLLNDITHQYPELHGLPAALRRDAILDGEVVAFDAEGVPRFQLLQSRMGLGSGAEAQRRMGRVPVDFIGFDVLWLDGTSLLDEPWTARREVLEGLDIWDTEHRWHLSPVHRGEGPEVLAASRAQRLEGIVAKRLTSVYEPGRRSGAWLKVKNWREQEFVIGGWTAGEGHRAGRIGALVVGYHRDGRLVGAGKVGTGYTDEMLARLGKLLEPLRRPTSPFQGGNVPRDATFVEPRLVASVAFSEWTREGTLRQPSFKGLRDDKRPEDVVREEVT